MKQILELIKKYGLIILAVGLYIIIYFLDHNRFEVISAFGDSGFIEMFVALPPIMALTGFIKVWVGKDQMMKLMGEKAGIRGSVIAFLLGTVGVGPLYMAFPIAIMFFEKGATFFNIFIFMGSWATVKISQILFEMQSLGVKYTLLRLFFNIISIILIAVIMNFSITENEKSNLSKL